MKMSVFLSHCTACGGNWTAMLGSGIRELWPADFNALPDTFEVTDVLAIMKKRGVVFDDNE